MAPPKWLVHYWKEEPNWIKRFVRGTEINHFLCGLTDMNPANTLWTPKAIREFQAYMDSVVTMADKDMILYRGSTVESPTMHPLMPEMVNCQYMSTTKSRAIAKEFAGKKDGYLHVLHVKKGVRLYDLDAIYGENVAKREKEVLIYPGARLVLQGAKGHVLTWDVYAS